mmetsp:Transcript_85128/g.214648  ORF Transcript_85128/g.214648 Transcript_85128/m.214648 type:complete len:265 (+) Transcript_85128:628-1422(+)
MPAATTSPRASKPRISTASLMAKSIFRVTLGTTPPRSSETRLSLGSGRWPSRGSPSWPTSPRRRRTSPSIPHLGTGTIGMLRGRSRRPERPIGTSRPRAGHITTGMWARSPCLPQRQPTWSTASSRTGGGRSCPWTTSSAKSLRPSRSSACPTAPTSCTPATTASSWGSSTSPWTSGMSTSGTQRYTSWPGAPESLPARPLRPRGRRWTSPPPSSAWPASRSRPRWMAARSSRSSSPRAAGCRARGAVARRRRRSSTWWRCWET